jgi:S-adenosylmethionine:tRNA ribosyltransferase-isomerase
MLVKHPRHIQIKDYTYVLPEEKIARFPLSERDASRLLVYREDTLTETTYKNIDEQLPANSLLVFNNTKVVAARILFHKPTGGTIEIFCLEPHPMYHNIQTGLRQQGRVLWKCLVGGASKWKAGQVLERIIPFEGENILLEARFIEKQTDSFIIELIWQPHDLSFAQVLQEAGVTPLPPYIKRIAETTDKERYQTIYALHHGSVAAPTAGLHFTAGVFNKLHQKNIHHHFITLHVGAGTFKPVIAATIEEHTMHEEFIQVTVSLLQQLLLHPQSIYAVGTTSLRTLETLYWMGVKTHRNPLLSPAQLVIQQWEVYDELLTQQIPVDDALESLLGWMKKNGVDNLLSKTQLLIAPGYSFKIIKGLITNFHQPQSTLLLLVAALAGPNWKKIYEYALHNDFRFLSYGDGCLLELKK